ncbi:unnamed protein product [Choristocarpus tenellus]
MLQHLTSTFTVMQQNRPEVFEENQTTPLDLAAATTRMCFLQSAHVSNGQLSYKDFEQWLRGKNDFKELLSGNMLPTHCCPLESPSMANAHTSGSTDVDVHFGASLLRLGLFSVRTMLQGLVSAASEEGHLTQLMFNNFLQGLDCVEDGCLPVETDVAKLSQSIFWMFDTHRRGVVHVLDMAAGLALLCDGGVEVSGLTSTFELYCGATETGLSMHEMTSFMSSVLKVLFATSPEDWEPLGVTPEDMAKAAVIDYLAHQGLDPAYRLSFADFNAWYVLPSPSTVSAVRGASTRPCEVKGVWMPLLGELRLHDVQTVLDLLAACVDQQEDVSLPAFLGCIGALVEVNNHGELPTKDQTDLKMLLVRLYNLFDPHGQGKVPFRDLASGLSILCRSDDGYKVQAVFDIFKSDADGCISQLDMTRYLAAVFRVLFEVDPSSLRHVIDASGNRTMGPAELADITATQAFEISTLNADGKLSMEEFEVWYFRSIVSYSTKVTDQTMLEGSLKSETTPFSECDVQQVYSLFKLYNRPVKDVFNALEELTNEDGLIQWTDFRDFLCSLGDFGAMNLREAFNAVEVAKTFFKLFEKQGRGEAQYHELASGLSVICGGSWDERAAAVLALLDAKDDGSIIQQDMYLCLSAMFKVLCSCRDSEMSRVAREGDSTPPSNHKDVGSTGHMEDTNGKGKENFAQWLSRAISMSKFAEKVSQSLREWDSWTRIGEDTDGQENGVLTMSQLPEWVGATDTVSRDVVSRDIVSRDIVSRDVVSGDVVSSLERIRGLSRLGSLSVNEALGVLSGASDDHGFVYKEAFYSCLHQLHRITLQQAQAEGRAEHASLVGWEEQATIEVESACELLFNALDTDRTGKVDFCDLGCGLSVLCGGSRDDNVEAAFGLFDTDRDGYMTVHELERYLTTVYRSLYALRPGLHIDVGAPPEVLGRITATRAMQEARTEQNGHISVEELKMWYLSSSGLSGANNECTGGAMVQHTGQGGTVLEGVLGCLIDVEKTTKSLQHARQLLHLDCVSVNDLLEMFAEVSMKGTLTLSDFKRCIGYVLQLGGVEKGGVAWNNAAVLAERIHKAFANSDGIAEYATIICGLSILCPSSIEEKVNSTGVVSNVFGTHRS